MCCAITQKSRGNFEVRGSLKNVEEELPKGLFAKCSNWCLVGLTHVAEIRMTR